jgi:glycosyltransferase involved in cell wall biosynthesis
MRLKYCGPAKDYSGYGEANRHDIAALVGAGIDVTTEIPVYTLEPSDFGPLGQIALERENKDIGYKIKILHTTPNVYTTYMESDKYHIARAFWETDKLPADFSRNLTLVDEIWTGSKYNEQAIRNSGVENVPIYIIPEAIDESLDITKIDPFICSNNDGYRFYSIFEWTERKNPKALLEAFWRAFEGKKDVSLTIKTYVDNFKSDKKGEIDRDIKKLKARLNLKSYAPVYLYRQLMDRRHIYRFHKTYDCFVSAHRGEGWGIPQMEALLLERPVISTNAGGIHEYLTRKEAITLPYKPVPVSNTRNQQWYAPDQKWAEVDIEALIEALRFMYKNQAKGKRMGKAGRKLVIKEFGLAAVGAKMKARLNTIANEVLLPDQ